MRRRQHQQAVVILVLVTLICEVSSQSSQCCPSISVTSTSVGEEYQAVQLGVYTIKDNLTVNGRPVYKQIRGDQYFYYWVRNFFYLITMKAHSVCYIDRFSPRTDMMTGRTGWSATTTTTGDTASRAPTSRASWWTTGSG